jgi:PAS domain S-box-containing protein
MQTTPDITINTQKQKLYADPFRQRVKRRSDKLTNQFLIIYFLGGFICAAFYDTWLVATGGGCIYLLIYYSVKIGIPETNLYQYVLSGILGLFMAQYIYQMHGMFEVYFFAFIGSTCLIMYQNWKLQIPLFIIVVFHLSIFGYHQNSDFNNPYYASLSPFELQRFILHILLAALVFFICGLWSYLLKKYSEIQIEQTKKMEALQMEALLAVKEQAAVESNTRFSYAAQATSDAIWDRNYSEDKVFWGDGYRTLFGYDITPETASVSFWASKVHPEDIAHVTKTTLDAKENPSVNSWTCEYRFLKANDEYAYVKEKAIILRNEHGIPCRTIGALQDISDIKLNEFLLKDLNESLEKEKYYLDSLMDNMPDAIYFKDKESKFLRVSKYMVSKYFPDNPDASINDIIGKSDFDFEDPVHANEAYNDEQEIQKTKKPKIDYIEKETRADGSERWVATTKMPLKNLSGEIVGTFGISRDITKLKKLEKEQHEAQLDKAVAQGKFEIASGVMHDIGNAVVGFGSHLTRVKRLQEKDNSESLQQLSRFFEEQRAALGSAIGENKADAVIKMLDGISQSQKNNQQEISKSIADQLTIIANIEEILNIQRQYISGHESKERKPANLKNIINDSLSMLYSSVDKLSVNVSLNIADDLPLIKGDHTKLMQLMLNVLKNSIDAVEGNPAEKTIAINAYTDANKLVLQVKDNSNGITTKSPDSTQTLNNCRAIVESHEGTIDITNEGPGKGTLTTIGFKILAA